MLNPRQHLHKSRTRKSYGENTTKRQSLGMNRIWHKRRAVLDGFPWEGQFKTREEVDAYFSGDRITCLLCGKSFKMLCTHLVKVHGISVDSYKERFGLPWCRGLCAGETRNIISKSQRKRSERVSLLPYTEKCRRSHKNRRPRPPYLQEELVERARKQMIENNKTWWSREGRKE